MRVGIDARFFGPRAKGIGRYNQKLLEELEKLDSQNDYVVFLRRENFDEFLPQKNNFKKVLADFRWYSWGEQLIFPFLIYRQKVDLMHFTHFNLPIFYFRPYVLTLHDLILQRFGTARGRLLGRLHYGFKNLAYKIIIKLAARRAQKIIAVSSYVKNDIVKMLDVSAKKIAVIYEGAPILDDGEEQIANSKEILNKYKIKKPYLLYVGNAYPHKNLPRLIEAFKILKEKSQPNLQLALVGGEDYFYRQLKKKHCDNSGVCLSGGVIFTGFVSDNELKTLYEESSAYVFPSLCEGFGLPPLEAMARKTAVAASSETCLPEILGQAAHYFDAKSPVDIAAKINEVLFNEELRQKLVEKGLGQIKKYSWQKMAGEVLSVYQNQ